MANTRPDIIILPNQDNDVYSLLNAQVGYPPVAVGSRLRIQNKSGQEVYLHQTDQVVTDFVGGTRLPVNKQACTDDIISGCKATVTTLPAKLQVEVL